MTPSLPSRIRLRHAIAVVLAALATAVLVVACDQDLIDDATFRLWCRDAPCAWRLDAGKVRPAPTWHKEDLGIELVDPVTTLSQELKDVRRCLTFTTITDVDPGVDLSVGIDFDGDGEPDWRSSIASVGFGQTKTVLSPPRTDLHPRVFILKNGAGRAVVAQIRLQGNDDGNCGPRLRRKDLPLGSPCAQGPTSECTSGVCCQGLCAECCPAEATTTDERDFDEHDGHAKPPEGRCAGDAICEKRDLDRYLGIPLYSHVPMQCNPGRGDRAAGASCLADDDCTSQDCDGAVHDAEGASAPDGGNACDPDFPDAGGDRCRWTRVREGRCR